MARFSFLDDAATMVDLMERHHERMAALARYTDLVMRSPLALTRGECELIAAYVSALNGCRYCAGAHKAFAESHGVEPALLDALIADLDTAPIAPKMRALLAFCRKLNAEPAKVTDADGTTLREQGWAEAAIEDAIFVTASFNLYNRLMDGYGIAPRSDERNRQRAALIREWGYDFTRYPEGLNRIGSADPETA